MAHDVFITYSSHDKSVAEAVCATLESRRIPCWIAPRDVVPGAEWAEAIVDAIDSSRVIVLVLSSSSNNSPQVVREVGRAAGKGIPIIPLRIDDVPLSKTMEYFVSSHHWLDAHTPPLKKHLQRLGDTVQHLLAREIETLKVTEISAEKPTISIEKPSQAVNVWWWLLPVVLALVGGLISWVKHKDVNRRRASYMLILGIVSTLIWTIPFFLFYTTSATPVTFPDSNLEAVIRETINKPEGSIYKSGLEAITTILAQGKSISDLTILEYCVNLKYLDLKQNDISDISPLVENSGLSEGDTVDLMGNPLSTTSVDVYIPQLEQRGVNVLYSTETAVEHYERGVSLLEEGKYEQAISEFEQAIELDPAYVVCYFDRGLAYYYKGEYDMAFADFDKAIKLDPDYAAAYNFRGDTYLNKGEYDMAIADFTKAIQLSPYYSYAYHDRGLTYYYKGEYDRAITDLTKAIELNPNDAAFYYLRGYTYLNKGEYDMAIADLTKAIELNPNDAASYYTRGIAYQELGKKAEAIDDLERCIELSQDPSLIRKAEQALGELRS